MYDRETSSLVKDEYDRGYDDGYDEGMGAGSAGWSWFEFIVGLAFGAFVLRMLF